jgi:hypothetical protein
MNDPLIAKITPLRRPAGPRQPGEGRRRGEPHLREEKAPVGAEAFDVRGQAADVDQYFAITGPPNL